MNEKAANRKNKGGRPTKDIRKSNIITLKCTAYEKLMITIKAKEANLCLSEYIREVCLHGKVENRSKVIPPPVLALTGTLNHMAANLNQVSKKRNSQEQLSDMELEAFRSMALELKAIAAGIKCYLQ